MRHEPIICHFLQFIFTNLVCTCIFDRVPSSAVGYEPRANNVVQSGLLVPRVLCSGGVRQCVYTMYSYTPHQKVEHRIL